MDACSNFMVTMYRVFPNCIAKVKGEAQPAVGSAILKCVLLCLASPT